MNLAELNFLCQEACRKPHGWVGSARSVQANCRCGGPALCRHCLLEQMTPLIERLVTSTKLSPKDVTEDVS